MALFGRKKNEDEDDELENDDEDYDDDREESLRERRLKRELRDLKRENRKKRKEPPKPWGKNERLLILILLGATVLISGILTIGSRGLGAIKFSGLRLDINAPDFGSLNIFKEETIEIRKSK